MSLIAACLRQSRFDRLWLDRAVWMRDQATPRNHVDPAAMPVRAQRQDLIDHRQAGTQNTDIVIRFDGREPAEPPWVLHDAALHIFRHEIRRNRHFRIADTQAERDMSCPQHRVIVEMEFDIRFTRHHAGGCLGLDEIDGDAIIPAAQKRGEPVPEIKPIVTARGKIIADRLAPLFFQPVEEILRFIRKGAHPRGRDIQAMQIELAAIGSAATEPRISTLR